MGFLERFREQGLEAYASQEGGVGETRETPDFSLEELPEERLLQTSAVVGERALRPEELEDGIVSLVKLEDGSRAIFKTSSSITDPRAERAAYLIDRLLGSGLVPTTVLRTIGKEHGSLQRFIENAREGSELSPEERQQLMEGEEMLKLHILDYIIGNYDRREANWLVGEGRLWAIDHGFAFQDHPLAPSQRTVAFLKGRTVPEGLRGQLASFFKNNGEEAVHSAVQGELNRKAARGVTLRLNKVREFLEAGQFPYNMNGFKYPMNHS